jgi:hypothetical protein
VILEESVGEPRPEEKYVRPHKAIIHPRFQPAKVKVFPVAIQWCISILLGVILVFLRLEHLSKEVTSVSKKQSESSSSGMSSGHRSKMAQR